MRQEKTMYRFEFNEVERVRREAIELRNRAIGDAVRVMVRGVFSALDRLSFLSPSAQLRSKADRRAVEA